MADVPPDLVMVATPYTSGPEAGSPGSRSPRDVCRAFASGRTTASTSNRKVAPPTSGHRHDFVDYFRAEIAVTLCDERTNIVPFDSAGVAISSSPIEFVARCVNVRPAAMTRISPSSFDR